MGRRVIHKPEESIFWFIVKGDVLHVGETRPNERTDTGLGEMVTAESLGELISKLAPHKHLLPERPRGYRRRFPDLDDKDIPKRVREAELIPDKIYNDRGTIKAPRRRPRS